MAYCSRCDRPVDGPRCPDCGADTHERPQVRRGRDLEATEPELTVADPPEGGMLGLAARYPLAHDRHPLYAAAAMVVLSPLVLPLVTLWGYAVHVARAAARGDETPPEVDRWGSLLVSGAFAVLAGLPLAIGGFLVVLTVAVLVPVLGQGGTWLGVAALVAPILVVGYLVVALGATMVAMGSVRGAYRNRRFLRVAGTGTYLVGFLALCGLCLPVIAVFLGAASLLTITPYGLPLVVPLAVLVSAYVTLVGAAFTGLLARQLAATGILGPVYEQESLELTL